jgi:hypothetical protein
MIVVLINSLNRKYQGRRQRVKVMVSLGFIMNS